MVQRLFECVLTDCLIKCVDCSNGLEVGYIEFSDGYEYELEINEKTEIVYHLDYCHVDKEYRGKGLLRLMLENLVLYNHSSCVVGNITTELGSKAFSKIKGSSIDTTKTYQVVRLFNTSSYIEFIQL